MSANPYAPPRAAVEAQPAHDYWREGKVVVTRSGGVLPARCVRCNEPAVEPMKARTFYWHHAAWYLLVLINIFIYVIVALIVRRKASVTLGLCAQHWRRRKIFLAIGWGGFALGFLLAIAAYAAESDVMYLGIPLMVLAALVGLAGGRIAYPIRITKEEVRLRGCGPAFLDSLESR